MSGSSRQFCGVRVAPPDAPWTGAGPARFLPAVLLLWRDRATVHVVAEAFDGDNDDALAAYRAAFERWAEGDRTGRPPSDPCSVGFRQLQIDLTDERGTTFTSKGRASGGSSNEWEASARYTLPANYAEEILIVRMQEAGTTAPPTTVAFGGLHRP